MDEEIHFCIVCLLVFIFVCSVRVQATFAAQAKKRIE